MLFKKIHFVIGLQAWHFSLFVICCPFCSDFKNENIRDSVQRGQKSEGV